MIKRERIQKRLTSALRRSRVVLLSGPRQSGKTTLARGFVSSNSPNYFDLENPLDLERLSEPFTALAPLKGLVVIDEVQRKPDLFNVLRVLVDREEKPSRFLILGSASGSLLRQTSESLAGRLEIVQIEGFILEEVGEGNLQSLWFRGGFPPSFLSFSDEDSFIWRKNFIQTLLERDFPQWGVKVPASALSRFWRMLAHYHGQNWNAAEPARALGVNQNTTRRHLDLLTDVFMIRQLQPYYANLRKRQVKSPKIYIRDTGLLHQLLGISTLKQLLTHPKIGASWEGFVIEQILAVTSYEHAFFWATHQGAEIDLILQKHDELLGIECKRADSPKITPSIRIALEDLKLSRIAILYPGNKRYHINKQVEAVPLSSFATGEFLFQ
ncbi:MAG: ATP-binding protein [Candidatus Sabulitectum sp.]|nr:ATP-binding protein [Candidatus Sabulitectum sp.]